MLPFVLKRLRRGLTYIVSMLTAVPEEGRGGIVKPTYKGGYLDGENCRDFPQVTEQDQSSRLGHAGVTIIPFSLIVTTIK